MLDRIADSTLVKVVTPQLSSGPLGGALGYSVHLNLPQLLGIQGLCFLVGSITDVPAPHCQ